MLPTQGDPAVCHGRDYRVSQGDRVTVFGTPDELRAAADWRMATALAALILVLVGATLILHAVYWLPSPSGHPRHISLLSAGYFAVETVATVGYRRLQLPRPGPVADGRGDRPRHGRHQVIQTLEAASLPHAAAVAVVTSDDLANLETGLAVRDQLRERWRKVPVVLRMFDSPFAQSVRHNFGH